jgi:hypothetical protein
MSSSAEEKYKKIIEHDKLVEILTEEYGLGNDYSSLHMCHNCFRKELHTGASATSHPITKFFYCDDPKCSTCFCEPCLKENPKLVSYYDPDNNSFNC